MTFDNRWWFNHLFIDFLFRLSFVYQFGRGVVTIDVQFHNDCNFIYKKKKSNKSMTVPLLSITVCVCVCWFKWIMQISIISAIICLKLPFLFLFFLFCFALMSEHKMIASIFKISHDHERDVNKCDEINIFCFWLI